MTAYKPASKILDRSTQTKASITAIEREQFAPLPPPWTQFYQEVQAKLLREVWDDDESEEACVRREVMAQELFGCQEKYRHTKQDISTIITTVEDVDKLSINPVILDDYVNAIADYANRLRWAKTLSECAEVNAQQALVDSKAQKTRFEADSDEIRGRSRHRNGSRSRSQSPPNNQQQYRDRSELRTSPSSPLGNENMKKCIAVITNKTFTEWILTKDAASREEGIRNYLQEQDLPGKQFTELDYLFIPYHVNEAHYILMGIAPKQRFIFVIDSTGWRVPYSINRQPLQTVFALASILIDPGEDWPIFTEWATRGNGNGDASPNCALQKDLFNCGIFATANAMCLAFGYDLLCYKEGDLNEGKRPRMFAELWSCGAFEAPFNYDLFEMPGTFNTEEIPEEDEADVVIQHGFLDMTETIGPYPRQFSSRDFKKAGFLYAPDEEVKKYWNCIEAKEALVNACNVNRIVGYEEWSQWSVNVFRRWIINRCTASRKSVDEDLSSQERA